MPRPRSTLFPYTTLFRSYASFPITITGRSSREKWRTSKKELMAVTLFLPMEVLRSEERFSRNAETEIYTLSLHDALPILCFIPDNDYRAFLKRKVENLEERVDGGNFILTDGSVKIGRAVQQECRDRDLHSFPTRRSSDLMLHSR